ncbi:uncharacterized protein LOC124946204 [Impatiens glandulifera]|uniref:uncharacterized protein LOC124946204 n=1 Tax=Impatiens glandulifera TaxID=253017 RepID=UPI001FB154E8|nr:uncharacterized protein LOC124946204 [Impatiens glandulifera]
MAKSNAAYKCTINPRIATLKERRKIIPGCLCRSSRAAFAYCVACADRVVPLVPMALPLINGNSDVDLITYGTGQYGVIRAFLLDRVNYHLSSRTIPIQGHDETTTDTEHEEVYEGERYSSLDSPPQEDNVSTNISVLRKNGAAERYSIGKTCGMVYTDDDSDDTNSEYSSTQPVNNDPLYRVRTYESNGYYGSSSCGNFAAEKVTCTRNLHYEKLYDDHDDAPFFDSAKEIKQSTDPREQVLTSRVNSHIINTHETVTGSLQFPTFHASSQGPWLSVIAYDACVRLCLRAWAEQCMEAPIFLESECALLRNSFGLQNILLKPEEELLEIHSSIQSNEIAVTKPRKMVGKMKVQVIKVKTAMDPPTGFNLSSLSSKKIKLYTTVVQYKLSNIHVRLSSGWRAVGRIRFTRERIPSNRSFSRKNMATYVRASSRYVKQVSRLVKVGVKTLRSNSSSRDEGVPVPAEATTYTCSLRLKSSSEEEAVRLNPGSGETHVFFPDSLGDNLIVEINDSKGNKTGRVVAQIAEVAEDLGEKLRWWTIYREPEHEIVGKLQLYINYSTTLDENNLKFGNIAETVAYDLVLEVAMKVQKFQRRNLSLHGPWKWLLIEFTTYYGVSDAYSKLRYLSYIMEVATPTADCLTLVYDLLFPVIMKRGDDIKRTLSHQENRILGDVEEQINQILGLVFENYKCLDENSQSGMKEVFIPSTGIAAPALEPAVKLFTLLHDIYSPESQAKLYAYFQAAAKKRARRNLTETDEFVTGNNDAVLMDPVTNSTAYKKMKSLCLNFRNEIFTDMEIHNQHVLPEFIDLPNLSSAIYCVELSNRLRRFLIVCPPIGPTPHVTELVIATADLQKDLCNWNIK